MSNGRHCMKSDGKGIVSHKCAIRWNRILKRAKVRGERREAKRDPECQPTYGRYGGWFA